MLLVLAQNSCPPVVHLQALDSAHGGVEQLAPLDRLRENAAQRVQFAIDGRWLQRFWCARLSMCPPLARESFAFELFDPMRRDLVENQRTKRAIENVKDLASRSALRLFGSE